LDLARLLWNARVEQRLNVLERSPLLDELVNGEELEAAFKVNGAMNNLPDYLADGKYFAWTIFQKSISQPSTNKRKLFGAIGI
jgi:hypothetical protein